LFVGDLAAVGYWVVANVQGSVPWPLQVETVEFRGHRIFLAPRSTATVVADGSILTMYPFAAVKLPAGGAFEYGCRLLSHFLSSLSWVEGAGIAVEHWSAGSRAHPMGENRMSGLSTAHFELDYLPDPTDQRVRWALAFYREGLSLERFNVAYAALSFFKILNIVVAPGKAQVAWINANHAAFGATNHAKCEITRRITELNQSGITDIGRYLYGSGRCAVAHAGLKPTVDPESPEDNERLSKDLPLIRALAAHVIETEFQIKSPHTIWREHLYELAGFKDLLGAATTDRLMAKGNSLQPGDVTAIDRLRLGIKGRPKYAALENLLVRKASIAEGKLQLFVSSSDGLVEVDLALDFPDEQMLFDMDSGLRVSDDGSENGAKQMVSVLHFMTNYIGNGKLQIFDARTDALLGRKDAYIPMNVVSGFAAKHFNQLITKYEAEAQTRAAKSSSKAQTQ
jgi:hypothetical protein